MAAPVWDKYLSESDRAVFEAAGFGARAGFGERPALLVVDVTYAFCGDKPEPVLDSIRRWPLSCGESAWTAMPVLKRLIDAARAKGLPVIYSSSVTRPDRWDMGSWSWKNPRNEDKAKDRSAVRESNHADNEIVEEIAPADTDIVVYKKKPSVFFEAPLQSYLQLLKADSVIVTGTTTSGCVRATAIDAFSHNYRVAVVEEACFDRVELSHAVALLDLGAKYADIVNADEAVAFMEGLPDGLFELPQGTV